MEMSPAMRELLDMQARIEEWGGVPANEDELVREGVIRGGPKLWVQARAASVEDGPPWIDPFDPLPVLRFVISDADHRPLHSFAIEKEIAQDALGFVHPSLPQAPVPAPAFVDLPLRRGLIRRGSDRYLTMMLVTLDLPGRAGNPKAGAAVRFEVADEDHFSLFNFTIDWPLAFFLVKAARPEHV
jgi:hypothetical protein